MKKQRTLFILFTVALWLPNIAFTFTEPLPLSWRLAQLLFGIGGITALMTIGKNPGKQYLRLYILTFYAAFNLVLLYLYGNSPIAVDMFLNVIATNSNEVGELLGNLIAIMVPVCGLYLWLTYYSIQCWRKHCEVSHAWRKRVRRLFALPLFVIGAAWCAMLQMLTPFRIHKDVYPVNVTTNLVLAIHRFFQISNYESNAASFSFNATATHLDSVPETYVLIIGETVRRMNMGLYGYERNTTPRLSNRKDLIVYRKPLTQSNTTHKSVPLILTAAEAVDPVPMFHDKSIISAFKEAGFKTWYISNQADNGALIDHYSREADIRRYVRDEKESAPDDADLLKVLNEEVAKGDKKRLFVLHMYGGHFKYCDRVPEEYAHFKPCNDVQLKKENHDELINAFDNTILYTDMIVDSIMNIVDCKDPAMCIFTSDHGEDIFDDERGNFLHASPVVSYYQIAVPFIVWTNQGFRSTYPEKVKNFIKHIDMNLAPGRVIFHTLLDAAGIECAKFKADHALGNKAYTAPEHHYLTDHNTAARIEEMHLSKSDLDALAKEGNE